MLGGPQFGEQNRVSERPWVLFRELVLSIKKTDPIRWRNSSFRWFHKEHCHLGRALSSLCATATRDGRLFEKTRRPSVSERTGLSMGGRTGPSPPSCASGVRDQTLCVGEGAGFQPGRRGCSQFETIQNHLIRQVQNTCWWERRHPISISKFLKPHQLCLFHALRFKEPRNP